MSPVRLMRERWHHWFADEFHGPLTARLIVAIAVALTAAAWFVSRSAVNQAAEERFQFQTDEIASAVHDRMVIYEQVLWGGVGLFNASDMVDRDEWHQYVATLDINEHWPGIQGVGYAIPLDPDEVDGHEAAVRSEGFPDYTVRPPGDRSQYSAITFLEPFDWRNQRAFGFDMWSNDIRREAMARARDTGLAATSGVITLVQETDEDVQKGFLTYTPVYEPGTDPTTTAERRAAFAGWVYAPFRMGDLMAGTLGSEAHEIDLEIFDGSSISESTLLYDSDDTYAGAAAAPDSDFQRTITVDMQGRQWTFAFQSGPDFVSRSEANLPILIAGAGIIIDVLLFAAISTLGFVNRRAATMAEEMTSELRAATDDLEQRSHDLEIYAGRLEQSNTELAQFAHIASHDLQEPLRSLGNYSALLTENYEDQLDDEGRRWLGYISTGSQRMSHMIRDLLTYSSVDAGNEPFTEVDLDRLLDDVLRDLDDAVGEAGATIERDRLPIVLGHEPQLARLLQNLIANGIKYRSKRVEPRIAISVSADEDRWHISIADNGIGIKPEYHERVFEIFRRVGSREEYPGNGIGLSVCRKIVHRHGGTIDVSSTPGEGSVFTFTLPRALPDQAQPGRAGDDRRIPTGV